MESLLVDLLVLVTLQELDLVQALIEREIEKRWEDGEGELAGVASYLRIPR